MKYLFFFNGQPLLLCCVCCKIAIQDFVTGLHKKNKKNLQFHRRTITRRYFTETCKKITGLCHNHRRVYRWKITRRYFTKSCKKITGLCHNHRRVYRCKISTDLRTFRSAHMSDTCPSAQIPTEFLTDRKVWLDFRTFFGAHFKYLSVFHRELANNYQPCHNY
jgi:hypothetical protein